MANESGNTRRTFLAASALGAVAGALPRGAAGTAGAADLDPEFTFDCSGVAVDDWGDASGARVEFRDGSYVLVGKGSPDRVGSPGRSVAAVVFTDGDGNEHRVAADDTDCDPGPPATTFTSSRATVRDAEFVNVDATPDPLISRVVLHFVDGTTQTQVSYERDPSLVDIATTYRGTGDHAGKVIEAVEISYDLDFTTHYLRNPAADKHLLGAETCRERCVEVVGATEGAVDYEFTVDGPVREASLTDRRGAGGNDAVTDNGDGTWTVAGTTGNPGYSDVYAVNGEVQSFSQTGGSGDYVLRECEWRVVEDAAASTDNLAVVATEEGELAYEFTVEGVVRPIPNAGERLSAEDNDGTDDGDGTVTVSGYTGNEGYGDSFAVTGPVTDFRRTGGDADFRIELNGREVSPAELVGD